MENDKFIVILLKYLKFRMLSASTREPHTVPLTELQRSKQVVGPQLSSAKTSYSILQADLITITNKQDKFLIFLVGKENLLYSVKTYVYDNDDIQ